jgi:NADPH:quinone reductase-like Zn-dependent oxidoreductase
MKGWQIPSFGVDSLEFVERQAQVPGPGEVLVEIRAVSLNFRDLRMVQGLYNPKLKLPRIPCSDGAGQVLAVGEGVTALKPGDRVAGIFMQNWLDGPLTKAKSQGALGGDIDGTLAEQIVLREQGLVRISEHLSFEEAATLPCAAVTAWSALEVAGVKPGDTVLIQGTGGVSIFALQFAKMRGARVLGVSSSDEKLERARALGLDAGLDYKKTPDWDRWVHEQTGGEGVELVIEVGGAGTLGRSLKSVGFAGTVAQIGVLAAGSDPLPIPLVLHKRVRLQGIYVGSRADFIAMNRAIAQAQLRPVFESFPWSETREVFKRMESGGHFGKLVMVVD